MQRDTKKKNAPTWRYFRWSVNQKTLNIDGKSVATSTMTLEIKGSSVSQKKSVKLPPDI